MIKKLKGKKYSDMNLNELKLIANNELGYSKKAINEILRKSLLNEIKNNIESNNFLYKDFM